MGEDEIIVVIENDDTVDDVIKVNVPKKKKKNGIWSLDAKSLRKELLKMSKPKLIKLCKKYTVPVKMTNTKHDMIQRLMNVKKSDQNKMKQQRRKTVASKHTYSHSVLPKPKKKKKKKRDKNGSAIKPRLKPAVSNAV